MANECLLELNIIEKNLNDGFRKTKQAHEDLLDDEALQMIMNPNAIGGAAAGSSVFDYVHPNCMVFNANGRLFVGDSRGHISVWDINVR